MVMVVWSSLARYAAIPMQYGHVYSDVELRYWMGRFSDVITGERRGKCWCSFVSEFSTFFVVVGKDLSVIKHFSRHRPLLA